MFDTKKLIKIKNNISNLIIRANLKYEDKWYPVAYILKKILPTKQNYNIYNKNLLAIIVLLEI